MRISIFLALSVLMLSGCDVPQAKLPNPTPTVPPPVQPPPLQPPNSLPAQPSQFPSTPAVVGALDTPQAAMQRYETAKNKRDFKTQAQCLTPETLQAFAAMQISNAVFDRLPPRLEKRGVTPEMMKQLQEAPADGRKEAIAAIVAKMTDLPGLFADTMSSTRPLGPPPPATVTSVDIQGDHATAHVVANVNGQAFNADVQLQKYADGWKVDDSKYYKAY
jgi:hypothetical protein